MQIFYDFVDEYDKYESLRKNVWEFSPSWRLKYKYCVKFFNEFTNKIEIVHFGERNSQHYFDKIGFYSHLDHLDKNKLAQFHKQYKTENLARYSTRWWNSMFLWSGRKVQPC